MRGLLDVNVLIALLDVDHVNHQKAKDWLSQNIALGWATCPITQNGCLRIMAQPRYTNPLTISQVASRLQSASLTSYHEFWPDDVTLLNDQTIDHSLIHGPRQLTDIYLLALAVRHQGRFVTFDTNIAMQSVRGATAKNLCII